MSTRYLHRTADILSGEIARDAKTLGGKGARLAWLADRGFAIPETWYLPARAFTKVVRGLPTGYELQSLLRAESTRALYLRAHEARRALSEAPWPPGLADELRVLYNEIAPRARWGVAVRSSATSEDGQLTSMAGLSLSRLGVFGEDAFLQAVREVWASLYEPTALEYLRAHRVRDAAMAVIVQPTVVTRASGVLLVPAQEDAHNGFVINASVGLGTSVVSGESVPDLYRIDDEGRVLDRTVSAHKRKVEIEGEALVEHAASPSAALSEEDLKELAGLGRRLRAAGNGGWDAEFTFELPAGAPSAEGASSKLLLVQARPLTARRMSLDPRALYSNANLGEALPGVATPMTWSVATAFAEEGWRRAFDVLGCKMPKGTELVANVYGRFYLNLTNLAAILGQLPWLDVDSLLELGGSELPAGSRLIEPAASSRVQAMSVVRLPMVLRRLWNEQGRLDERVAHFEEDMHKRVAAHRAMDLTILPDEGLGRRFREIERLLARTGRLLLTCASMSMALHVGLRALFTRPGDPEGRRGSLAVTAGIRDLESARPALALLGLARTLARDPAARRVLSTARTFDELPEGPFADALTEFLRVFGDRAVREAELSTPRWREDPATLFAMIAAAARGNPEEAERTLNERNEAAARELAREVSSLPLARRQLAGWLIPRAQAATRHRERLRSWVLVILGMLREVVLDADRRLGRLMPELAAERARWQGQPGGDIPDAFFLTAAELWDALDRARTNLAPFFRARRGEYARNARRPEPESTFRGTPSPVLTPARGERLLGTGASGGIVSGIACVIGSPHELDRFTPGEILITRTTDIGWTPVFPLATAIVTELGGTLSHAAIVAREFGVPTVVGVRGVTTAIQSGDRVRVDGDSGVVELLEARA